MESNPDDSQPTSDQSSGKTKKKNTMLSYIFVFSDLPACPIGLVVFNIILFSDLLTSYLNRPSTSMALQPEQIRSDELSLTLLAHARKKG